MRLRSARTQLRRVSRLTPRSLPMPSNVWLGSDRYSATASALNSAEYAFIAICDITSSGTLHDPVFRMSSLRGEPP